MPRLATGALLVSAAVCLVAVGTISGATGPAVIRLTDVQMNDTIVGPDDHVGSLEVIRQQLYGSANKNRSIGHAVVTCIDVGARERRCDGTYVLPRGSILTGAVLQTRLFYTAAITGGTGLYDNARGTLTVTETRLKPRREILLFRLSG
ncbi:MAG TPA: hypothetical protein VFA82_04710 [Gaiellaceae bacterium]|nr:hypothetical protein [Gaiellaceae bacterium]